MQKWEGGGPRTERAGAAQRAGLGGRGEGQGQSQGRGGSRKRGRGVVGGGRKGVGNEKTGGSKLYCREEVQVEGT